MDLAKIRKKLKEKGAQKQPEKERLPETSEAEEKEHEDMTGAAEEQVETADIPQQEVEESEPESAGETPSDTPEEEEEELDLLEFLVFTLSGEYYAFKLPDLQEVLKEQIITFVPKMPFFIRGVTSLRGKIIPVMDLKMRLSISNEDESEGRKQMVIIKGPKGLIGVIIDKVVGVKRIEESLISEPPSHLDEKQIAFIDSVVRDKKVFISILDAQEVFDFQPYSLGRRAS